MTRDSILGQAKGALRRFLPGSRPLALVAIEVGETCVRAIHVRRDGSDLVLDGYRAARFDDHPRGRSQQDALRHALELRLDREPLAFCLGDREASIRKIELPPLTPQELHDALPWEARRHVANLPDDTILDAQVLARGGEKGPMEVLLVAFPRAPFERLQALCAGLDVTPEFVDLSPLATLNAFVPPASRAGVGTLAVLDLGDDRGMFSAFSPSDILLFRDLSARSARLGALLAEHFSLDAGGVDALRTTGKLPGGKPPERSKVEEALADLSFELAEDVRSALVFVENRTGHSIDRVHLTGANAHFLARHGITDAIAAHAGVPIERYNPFHGFRLGLVDELGLKTLASEFCPPVGLAHRYFAGA